MSGVQYRSSPKLLELTKWEKIDKVNSMLDDGVSPAKVCEWINKNGFSISVPLIYDYNKMRKQAMIEGIQVTKIINPIQRIPVINSKEKQTEHYQDNRNKLKNELDALDHLIQKGYETLVAYEDRPVSPKLMMEAISLKNNLTKGNHMNLTDYGIEYLKELEQKKFQVVLETLLQFVPEDERNQAIEAIEQAEDEFYKDTEYYDEYLKAKGETPDDKED